VELGAGFAGPAVIGNRVIAFHRVAKNERIECFDAVSGKSQWKAEFPSSYGGGVNPDNGPRCVPVIHQDRVFVFGAAGDLHGVALVDGRKVWSRETYVDFNGQEGYFGAGATPIVAGDKLLVNVGGRNAGIVAFDIHNGKTVWQATDERASYSSPAMVMLDGRPFVVFITRLQCLAVDPTAGDVLFRIPFGKTGPTVNAATPLVIGDKLFLSASYGVGARCLKLAKAPTEIWSNDESMSSQYTTCVHHHGDLFGIHGREDFNNGELRCVELATGKVRWQVAGFGVGHLVLVGSRLLIMTTDGQLVLAEANRDRYTELARATISTDTTRALPALSNGRFFFRDNTDRGGRLTGLALPVGN
jgi:outer membrane protein assembly factor BamB